MNVGEYIKYLRQEKQMTQEELGAMLGVKRAAVQKWECGRVQNLKRETIQKLSEIFNVSPVSFIEISSDSFHPSNVQSTAREAIVITDKYEKSLINNYRNLSDQGKEYILQTMEMAVKTYKKDSGATDTKIS